MDGTLIDDGSGFKREPLSHDEKKQATTNQAYIKNWLLDNIKGETI